MDEKTNNTLDALAELFLTEDQSEGDVLSGPAPIKMRPKAAQAVHPSSMNEPPEPTLGELEELTQELLGSAAELLAKNQETDPTASDYQQPTLEAAEDEGPKLRLAGGQDDSESSEWSGARPQPIVGVAEAVVLGWRAG